MRFNRKGDCGRSKRGWPQSGKPQISQPLLTPYPLQNEPERRGRVGFRRGAARKCEKAPSYARDAVHLTRQGQSGTTHRLSLGDPSTQLCRGLPVFFFSSLPNQPHRAPKQPMRVATSASNHPTQVALIMPSVRPST